MPLVYIGLGGNIGDRMEHIAQAQKGLSMLRDTVLIQNAPVYESKPIGGPADQENFYNSISLLETQLEPTELLEELQKLEKEIGRNREEETVRWGPRIIDLDIIMYDDAVIEERNLIVPHPRMTERAFVLLPLADIDPDLHHPVVEMTVRELLERMDLENEGIHRLPL